MLEWINPEIGANLRRMKTDIRTKERKEREAQEAKNQEPEKRPVQNTVIQKERISSQKKTTSSNVEISKSTKIMFILVMIIIFLIAMKKLFS